MPDAGQKNGSFCGLGTVWFVMYVICLCDYNKREIKEACPNLFEYMLSLMLISFFFTLLVILAPAYIVLAWDTHRTQLSIVTCCLLATYVALWGYEIYVINDSWTRETCRNVTSSSLDGQVLGGKHGLEIIGIMDIVFRFLWFWYYVYLFAVIVTVVKAQAAKAAEENSFTPKELWRS